MSFAETVMAATASIVVSPGGDGDRRAAGRRSVGVMLPEKVPESAKAVPPHDEEGGRAAQQGREVSDA